MVQRLVIKKRRGKRHQLEVNKVPLRGTEDAIEVNWCELTITDKDGRVTYRNAWVSDHPLSEANVVSFPRLPGLGGRLKTRTTMC
ncbi:MAG: hypothetical protein QNK37_18675 [Acidobacteriota bacterium]|nr:hypothetical protein [Acidobacteriota bacterium]